ncbi:MAG: DUF2029 domain-containing protein [Hymenobacteraceae bacterium]|nr:DUF2029 domain-containing protein [Hymenobacteraceae bacterium]
MRTLLRNQQAWLYVLLLVSIVLLTGEIINERFWMHDLEVYYRTAARMLEGKELYRIQEDGHYVYKYSPTAAVYFVPLSLLPFSLAKVVYWALLTAIAAAVLQLLYKMAAGSAPGILTRNSNFLLLAFLAVGAHIHREWHLGQVNLVLLGVYVLFIRALQQEKGLFAGLLLGASLFLKPFGLIFYPYLLLKKQYKALFTSLAGVVLLGLLPMVFYPSWPVYLQLNQSWLAELAIELSAKQNLLADANHTIFSVLARVTPIGSLLGSPGAVRVYQVLLLGLIALFLLWFIRLGKALKGSVVAEGALLISLIPLFAFTSQNAFLFTLPCIVVLLYRFKTLPAPAKWMTVGGCVLVGINIRDLMGSRLYNVLEDASVYTFGAVLLLASLAMCRYHAQKPLKQQQVETENITHA